jgi:hypothetical protein
MAKRLAGERYETEGLIDTSKSYILRLDLVEIQDTGNGNEVAIAKVTGHAVIQHVLVFSDQKNLFRSLKRNTGGIFRIKLLGGNLNIRRYSRTLQDGSAITGFTTGELQLMVNPKLLNQVLAMYNVLPDVPEDTQ